DSTGGQCPIDFGIANPTSVLITPDGRQVYVGSASPGGVAIFTRNPNTGDIVAAGCWSSDGSSPAGTGGRCSPYRGLAASGVALTLSPDGNQLYVGGGSMLSVFNRNPTTGALSPLAGAAGCVSENGVNGCTPAHGLSSFRQMAISPDGSTLYVPSAS